MNDEEAKLSAVREFLAAVHAESPDEFRRLVNFFLMQTGIDLPADAEAQFMPMGLPRHTPNAMKAGSGK